MRMKKRKLWVFVTAITTTFLIAIGSVSLAAEQSEKDKQVPDSGQYIEALAPGKAVCTIPALVTDHTKAAVRQAKTEYEEKVEQERQAEQERKAEQERQAEQERKAEQERQAEQERKEEELLAALIFCEAGNQPYEGQVAVGAVVMNRVRSSVYPNSISEVIYQSGQFTPAMTGWLDSVLASGEYTESAMQAATDALAGSNPIGDLLYFDCGGSGYQIGDHYFH